MFIHIFTYRFKCLIRDRELVFWTMLFPLLLATLFNMAFGRLDELDVFNAIPIAVVDDAFLDQNQDFKEVLTSVSGGEKPLFVLTQTDLETAKGLLEKGEITAYIYLDPEIRMMTRESGLNQTIVKTFIEEYNQTSLAISGILSQNPESLSIILQDLETRMSYLKDISMNNAKPNVVLNYFYSLIAMACIYGAFWGLKEITDIQADLSAKAARVNLAP
ncbi:MAG: ABC transporter permease, partial [Vallitaleaceae bacterium]|nr:ABC transporter permease [Vallitaleaceae bacterium]